MLQIVGSGFGRTGTVSLKVALERLGFGPCYHMTEVFENPAHVALWTAAAHAGTPDWRSFLGDYRAAIDWPSSAFWRELVAAYPETRVIHTERPEEDWYRSFANTIQLTLRAENRFTPPGWFAMVSKVIGERSLGGDAQDEEAVRSAYRANNAAVRAEIPADRLLVFDPASGWEPLCAFLGVAVPSVAYPNLNSEKEFRTAVGLR